MRGPCLASPAETPSDWHISIFGGPTHGAPYPLLKQVHLLAVFIPSLLQQLMHAWPLPRLGGCKALKHSPEQHELFPHIGQPAQATTTNRSLQEMNKSE
eukprot:scaffold98412_cov22-Tisochrysis_lutea.AAC.1